ncbi:hypothetical protein OROGR_023893 [Orobanche gracilis]
MEGLHVMMDEAISRHIIKGFSLPNEGPTISHSMFADDVIFLGEWDR